MLLLQTYVETLGKSAVRLLHDLDDLFSHHLHLSTHVVKASVHVYAELIAILTQAGIPVVAHIGFTPQSVNGLGGFRVQGRGDAAEQTVHDAIAVQESGAIAVVLEMVPAELATQITGKLTIPTVGIGAGVNCDAQVLVWQDMAGLTNGKTAKFVKRFGDVGSELRNAATQYANEVASGAFPADEHSF